MIYNIMISVQKVPLNPKLESDFVGLDNFKEVLADKEFYSSVLITIAFTFVVVVLSTILGLAMACFLNREFVGKKTGKCFSYSVICSTLGMFDFLLEIYV